jgi:predicted enzyme related to lactoylglutathione lyase
VDQIVQGALVILYPENIKELQKTVVACGGKLEKEIFYFPGGRRFYFLDLSANELAVWSYK